MRHRLALLCLLALPSAALAADPFTIEDFLQVPTLGATAVSPDGRQVAFVRTSRDLAEDLD